jgi:hypothetical protein
VKNALSTEDVLTINRTRTFTRKARDYKVSTYYLFIKITDYAMTKTGEDDRVVKDAIEHIVIHSKCVDVP